MITYNLTVKILIQNNKKTINYIKNYCNKNNLSIQIQNIGISIMLIEQYFRPSYKRFMEYIILYGNILLSLLFRFRLYNFTIGKSQIGITYILRHYEFDRDIHVESLCYLSFKEAITILFKFNSNDEIEILFKRISLYYNYLDLNNYDNILRKTGEMYNGKYSYGLLLESIYNTLN